MSDKIYNLTLPDGTTIPVPAWAREATLNVLVEQLKIGGKLNSSLIKEVADLNLDTDEIEDSIKHMFDSLEEVKRQETDDEKKARAGFAKGIAKATSDVVDALSDTSQPLSTMTKNAELAAGWLGKGGGSWLRNSKMLGEAFDGAGEFIASAADGLGDAFFAYAGFVAGQLESFAKAQANMINAGAIFFDASGSFQKLRESASNAGITYNQLSEIAVQYGTSLQVLGNGVSGGVTEFINQFKELNDASNQFGDFGLSNEQLAAGFAEFIEVSRLTGRVNSETSDASTLLQGSYHKLMQETTSLAALTGKSRDQLLAEQNEAMKNPTTAAALIRLREGGFGEEADVIETIVRQFANTAEYLPSGVSEMIQTAIGVAYGELEAGENPANIDLRAALRAADPSGNVSAILNTTGVDIMGKIQTAVANGATPEELRTFVFQEIAALEDLMPEIRMNTGETSAYAAMVLDFTNKSILANKDFNTLLNGTQQERDEAYRDLQAKMLVSGTATVALNELTTLFLQAQTKLTPDLEKSAGFARLVAGGMEQLANILNGQVQDQTDTGIGGGKIDFSEITTDDRDTQLQLMEESGELNPEFTDEIGDADVLEFNQAQMEAFKSMMDMSGGTIHVVNDPVHGEVVKMPHPIFPGTNAFMKARQFGGTVTPAANSQGYVVGEAGPEYFEPSTDGRIIPFSEMTSIIESSARAIHAFTAAAEKVDVSLLPTIGDNQEHKDVNIETPMPPMPTDIIDSFLGFINPLTSLLNPFSTTTPNATIATNAQPTTEPATINTTTASTVNDNNNNQIVQNIRPVSQESSNNTNAPDFEQFKSHIEELATVKETYRGVVMALRDEVKKYQRINTTGRTFG